MQMQQQEIVNLANRDHAIFSDLTDAQWEREKGQKYRDLIIIRLLAEICLQLQNIGAVSHV